MTDKRHHYRYTIDVDELGYAEIMQLVMKYGTGTGAGGSGGTAITTRLALAEAQIRIDREEEAA